MEVYNPVLKITWPAPGVFGISLGLSLLFIALVVYLLITYLNIRERERLHNYQLFLFQVKRRGLSNFQIKILNNMASYLRLVNPTAIVADAALFESLLGDFIEYLKKSRETDEERKGICRDLVIIYEKLYVQSSNRQPISSMSEFEDGQVLHITTDAGGTYLGKVSGRGKNFLALQLFTPLKNLKDFDTEQQLTIFVIRVNDAEYRIRTKSRGVEENRLLVEISEDLVREKQYRHPYISVVVPVVLIPVIKSNDEEDEEFEGTIYRINEYECELRTESPMAFEKSFMLVFEISGYSFKVVSRVITFRKVEEEKVFYVTLKFVNMTKPAIAVLAGFIADHL